MHQAQTRSLARAALLLLVVSGARYAWAHRPLTPPPASAERVEDLLTAAEEAAREASARARPLAPGERLDPNRSEAAELDRLPGVGPATARAWVRSREEEGPFRRPAELARVRGIGPVTAERLAPLLDFSAPPSSRGATVVPGARGAGGSRTGGGRAPPGGSRPPRIDLNRASEEELRLLPGIGPALARRILEARAQAPFRDPEDLLRVRGIGPATVARLRDRLVVNR